MFISIAIVIIVTTMIILIIIIIIIIIIITFPTAAVITDNIQTVSVNTTTVNGAFTPASPP